MKIIKLVKIKLNAIKHHNQKKENYFYVFIKTFTPSNVWK